MNKITLLVIFLLLSPFNAFAALTVVQHKFNSTGASVNLVSVTVTATGSGNLLVAAVIDAVPITSILKVSDGTNNFNQFPGAAAKDTTNAATSDIWYLSKSSSGKTTITVTLNGTPTYIAMEVWEVSGFTKPVPDKAAVVNNGAQAGGSATGAAVITTSAVGFVVGADVTSQKVTASPKAGNEFTSGGDIDALFDGYCSLISSTAASHQPVWTDGGVDFASSTAAFKDSTSGGLNAKGNLTVKGGLTVNGN